MNKAKLVEAVSKKAGLKKEDAVIAVESVLEVIKENVAEGVKVLGFGSFTQVTRPARKGRNPQTGAEIQIAEKEVVKFKAMF